jgi:Rieske Fe-S protein
MDNNTAIPRRTLAAAGLVTAAGLAAAACTRYGNPASQPAGGGSTGTGNASGSSVGKASDVPVGGGAVFGDAQVVVTQPTAGTFKGFSAVCTHQGCLVADVDGGTINCTCHGSKFNISDGSVVNGPASTPLPQRPVTVTGDQITLS